MDSNCYEEDLDGFLSIKHPPKEERRREVARKDLCETETLKKECLAKLKTLIRDGDVACIPRDDFLLRFLRYKKFCIEKSFRALRNYARFRVYIHDKLLKVTPELVRATLDAKVFGFLPYRDAEGRLLFFIKSVNWTPELCTFDEIVTVAAVVIGYIAENESSQVFGFVSVYDGTSLPFSYVIQMVPYFNFWRNYLFECLPVRYHSVYIFFRSKLATMVLPLVYPLIPQKIKDRIKIQTKSEMLCEYFSPDILPEEYGGNLGPLKADHLTDVLLEHLQKMKDDQRFFLQCNYYSGHSLKIATPTTM